MINALAQNNTVADSSSIADVRTLIAEIQAGRMVLLVDDENRENEGDLVVAAEYATTEIVTFMATKGCGLICLALTQAQADKMELSMQPKRHVEPMSTNFTVSIEAREGISSGISASDRSVTVQLACSETVTADDISTPGHIFPIIARDGGTLERPGHTEAAVDLTRLAGLRPAGLIVEVMKPNGEMARLPELEIFAMEHDLKIGRICDLIKYREENKV